MARMLLWITGLLAVNVLQLSCTDFDPFMDHTMFIIDWKGPLRLDPNSGSGDTENLVVMTKDKEKYQCILPQVASSRKHQENIDGYTGPSATELMESLFHKTSCSYRLESYWTYELCHGRHLRQYHESKEMGKKPKLQEYILGLGHLASTSTQTGTDKAGSGVASQDLTDKNIKYRKIDGIDLPYYEVWMSEGTPCDLTNQPRRTHALYVCQPDGNGELYELKEISTCEYEVMVLTSVLCSHPLFRPKDLPVNKISCHSMSGAPPKPSQLQAWEIESSRLTLQQENLFETSTEPLEGEEHEPQPVTPPPKEHSAPKAASSAGTSTPIGELTDRQMLKDILSGDYCLQGGTGWWKHEICLGQYARQFHKDRSGEISILLGQFNEATHLQWLNDHPNKRPKPPGQRKVLNYMYGGGDICDLTGKHRFVEVRLKCVPNSQNPHGVSLFLSEPASCEYVLVVESAMFCELIDKADNNALIKDPDL
ncbi:endoplasmic reticulum lectin 1-like [Pomacea canaliculata]|uniref:endoplasmic reticulum lectin 1-like n=1 Tax=Pomacea canaliculata TaxID=400727 RepID=UPI000D73A7A2|nr:endoplasmic reticulum lectin 1-like [Pomacea canaliculata]